MAEGEQRNTDTETYCSTSTHVQPFHVFMHLKVIECTFSMFLLWILFYINIVSDEIIQNLKDIANMVEVLLLIPYLRFTAHAIGIRTNLYQLAFVQLIAFDEIWFLFVLNTLIYLLMLLFALIHHLAQWENAIQSVSLFKPSQWSQAGKKTLFIVPVKAMSNSATHWGYFCFFRLYQTSHALNKWVLIQNNGGNHDSGS